MGGPPHADPPAPFAAQPFLPLRSPREPPRPSPPSHSSCSVRRGSRRALRRPVAWWSEGFDWKHQHDPGESPSAYKIIQGRITAPQEPFAPEYCTGSHHSDLRAASATPLLYPPLLILQMNSLPFQSVKYC
ncbi:hypothetical protein ACQJBY_049744 [Aegilops geniculata]